MANSRAQKTTMKTVSIEPHFQAWRRAARALLAEQCHPSDVLWCASNDEADGLLFADELPALPAGAPRLKVPKTFVRLAETVSAHRSGKQWSLLYQVLWEMTCGDDRRILSNQTDGRLRTLDRMRATVSRDIHKMRAFVRFREVKAKGGEQEDGKENFVAWFEPDHLIVRLNTPFFRKRFAGMNWSILTPDECVHWNGNEITYTEGVEKSVAPDSDELEELWLGYYRSIFNPARLKIKMMQTEMPKKYWKNLPEAEIIEELINSSGEQVQAMMDEQERPLKPVPRNAYLSRLSEMDQQDMDASLG
jgi:probable DNA metabolism protein